MLLGRPRMQALERLLVCLLAIGPPFFWAAPRETAPATGPLPLLSCLGPFVVRGQGKAAGGPLTPQ